MSSPYRIYHRNAFVYYATSGHFIVHSKYRKGPKVTENTFCLFQCNLSMNKFWTFLLITCLYLIQISSLFWGDLKIFKVWIKWIYLRCDYSVIFLSSFLLRYAELLSSGCLQNQANKIPGFLQDFQEFLKQFSRICLHKMSTVIQETWMHIIMKP